MRDNQNIIDKFYIDNNQTNLTNNAKMPRLF